MTDKPKWARGSNQWVKRPGVQSPSPPAQGQQIEGQGSAAARAAGELDVWRREDTGITWADFSVEAIKPTAVDRSRYRFRAHLPELIWNTAALEGNTFTLPEVETLLDGTTIGGKKLEDEEQILALSQAYNRLDELVGSGGFTLSKEVSDELHGLVAVHEAIEVGHFRGEGAANGGGNVRLSTGGLVEGTPHGLGGELLRDHFENLLAYLASLEDARQRALLYFASATRRQYYFDGNKRTARLMMTGELMASGYDIVSVPFARRLEFNNALDALFTTDDATELLAFLTTCTLPD